MDIGKLSIDCILEMAWLEKTDRVEYRLVSVAPG